MEEASQRASEAKRAPKVTPVDRVRTQRLHSLTLSRSRVLAQLERANVPAHRKMLMKALQAIEKEAEQLLATSPQELNGEG